MGNPITFAEAESFKITNSKKWINLSFANNWRKDICRRVKEYISIIPDERWLTQAVTLYIIITGGSGIVEGVPLEIKNGVIEGLRQRKLNGRISENVNLISDVLSG